jgi:hypothetical protein
MRKRCEIVAAGGILEPALQLIITPVRCASEATTDMADRLAIEMECQAHNEDRLRPTTVCLASLLTNME